ncbi:hypothetical protein V2I01_29725 [Micromonospora sp. BRA006-A]|nr:hypothetical protein [Micromonospora sp. BRA006-A]
MRDALPRALELLRERLRNPRLLIGAGRHEVDEPPQAGPALVPGHAFRDTVVHHLAPARLNGPHDPAVSFVSGPVADALRLVLSRTSPPCWPPPTASAANTATRGSAHPSWSTPSRFTPASTVTRRVTTCSCWPCPTPPMSMCGPGTPGSPPPSSRPRRLFSTPVWCWRASGNGRAAASSCPAAGSRRRPPARRWRPGSSRCTCSSTD